MRPSYLLLFPGLVQATSNFVLAHQAFAVSHGIEKAECAIIKKSKEELKLRNYNFLRRKKKESY